VNFSRFWAVTHNLRVNCVEMAGDKSRQAAHEIFSIKHRFPQFKSRPPMFKEACAGERQRWLPPLKSGYFTAIGSFKVKTVADRHRHTANHN